MAAAVEIAMYESLACAAAAAADEASSRYVPLIITLSSSPKEKGQQEEEQPQATWPDKPAATASAPNCDTGGLSHY